MTSVLLPQYLLVFKAYTNNKNKNGIYTHISEKNIHSTAKNNNNYILLARHSYKHFDRDLSLS